MPEPSEDVTGQPLTGSAPSVGRPARRFGLFVAVAVAVLLIDIGSKWLVVAHLRPGDSPRFLGGLFYFALVRNPGAAWGLASGQTVLFALVAVGVAVAIVRVAARLRSVPWAIALGLLLGGAVGNLIDRLFRSPGFLRGHVVDFISVFGPNGVHFPIFNLADSAITLGVVTLILVTLRGIGVDGRPLADEPLRSGRRGPRRIAPAVTDETGPTRPAVNIDSEND